MNIKLHFKSIALKSKISALIDYSAPSWSTGITQDNKRFTETTDTLVIMSVIGYLLFSETHAAFGKEMLM